MGLGHNDPWVYVNIPLWYGVKSNITVIAKVCDPESRRDSWFENCLFLVNSKLCETLFLNVKALTSN